MKLPNGIIHCPQCNYGFVKDDVGSSNCNCCRYQLTKSGTMDVSNWGLVFEKTGRKIPPWIWSYIHNINYPGYKSSWLMKKLVDLRTRLPIQVNRLGRLVLSYRWFDSNLRRHRHTPNPLTGLVAKEADLVTVDAQGVSLMAKRLGQALKTGNLPDLHMKDEEMKLICVDIKNYLDPACWPGQGIVDSNPAEPFGII